MSEISKQFSVIDPTCGVEISAAGYGGANQKAHKLLETSDVAIIVIRIEKKKASEDGAVHV